MGSATPFSCFKLVIRSRGEEQEGIKGEAEVREWQEGALSGQRVWLGCRSAACLTLAGPKDVFSNS